MKDKNILILGVGSLGSNLVSLLVPDLRGEHEITILDKDNVEERNVQAGTQFYTSDQIGTSKVEALQYNIWKWYEREIKIAHGELSEGGKIIGDLEPFNKYDLLIDCFDNKHSRGILQSLFMIGETRNILHIGFSNQMTFEISWAENYQVPSDITSGFDVCELQGASAFVKFVASVGALTVEEFIFNGKKREFVGGKCSLREIC